MSMLARDNGSTNQILRFFLMDNTSTVGAGLIGLARTETTLKIATIADVEAASTVYSQAGGTLDDITTLGTYAAPASGHCRFKEVDSNSHPGMYELQLLNTRFAISNATQLMVTVQATGFKCSPQSFLIDLQAQVDIRSITGANVATQGNGVLDVNVLQMGGSAARVTKLGLELDGRVTGTVSASPAPTATVFECSDISDSTSSPIYTNKGFLVTGGGLIKAIGTVLGDIVGTSGRRFTTTALPVALTAGDTVVFM